METPTCGGTMAKRLAWKQWARQPVDAEPAIALLGSVIVIPLAIVTYGWLVGVTIFLGCFGAGMIVGCLAVRINR